LATIVIDANFGVAIVWPLPYSTACRKYLRDWLEQDVLIVVPGLWEYEVCSALRKLWAQNLLTRDLALESLVSLFGLPLKRIMLDASLAREAIEWAERIGQTVAYDAQYLALAERLGADFWTADRKLFERCQKIEVEFVNLLN
jgi:predicted nucleic acid-binding protein